MNIPFRKQNFLVAQHPVDVNDGALFVEDGGSCDIVVVQGPNTFIELVAHVSESNGPFIAISIDIVFIECAESFTDDQMLLNELTQFFTVNCGDVDIGHNHCEWCICKWNRYLYQFLELFLLTRIFTPFNIIDGAYFKFCHAASNFSK